MKNAKYIWIAVAAVVCACVLGRAYTYKYRAQDTILVTGLGETEFTSDLIVWSGNLTSEAQNVATGYAEIEKSKAKVQQYLREKGLPDEAVVFAFVNVEKQYDPVYNANGNWAGQRFTGYRLSQRFTVESSEVEKVETISREISSLIAQGVSIEAYAPDYYYTKLDDVKMGSHRDRLGRCPHARREDRPECRHKDRARSLGPHGRIPDHRRQLERGVLGRRIVQHGFAPEEGPHYDAHRVSGEITG